MVVWRTIHDIANIPHDTGECDVGIEFDDIDNHLDNNIYGKDFPHNKDEVVHYGGEIRAVNSLRDDRTLDFLHVNYFQIEIMIPIFRGKFN